ncbi:prolipoprotein diacylglyceryl transferase [Rhodophyticola sp. CCM32]|uniref:prolipoprotein diacylglyceryl transferase n=1 Tax=Rhodophyticola sp. CCM32 TaxID=2916397 RepID=UPI00107FBE36|nr:prolipoprotein diacylglyceryl transferase [Rhodophyticola sp. CCM32]QBX99370.1 prolipoprotein diacylglyceryl transferase [Rhodophyticola sp. CCM32]
MQAAIPFPDISPELFAITLGGFEFALRWYALAYIAALLIGWWLVLRAVKHPRLWPGDTAPMTPTHVENLVTWVIIGVVLGGRLGFVLIYQPGYYLQNPAQIPMIWQGGMAFHGGLAGVLVAAMLFCRRYRLPMISVADALAMATPPGLLLGRIANFINAELWGRPTDAPWGVIFPGEYAQACPGPEGLVEHALVTLCARHPSQLYEAGLEGALLGAVIFYLVYRRGWLKVPGQVMGLFLAGYGLARFIVEYFRQADPQFITPDTPLGHVISLTPALGVSMGQLLSLPMLVIGIAVIIIARRQAA